MNLVRVADAAYPFDYGILPRDVRIVLHYIGIPGCTPHIVTTDEVAAVRAAGRLCYPIVTVPVRALTAGDGSHAAMVCADRFRAGEWSVLDPVFMDIEYSAYHADPAGAAACAAQWHEDMAARGWHNTHVYGPAGSGFDWLAQWTGRQPDTLPAGAIGVQYDHALHDDAYDISVFDPSVFPQEVTAMTFSPDEMKQVSDLLDTKIEALFNRLHTDAAGTYTREVSDLADAEQAKPVLTDIRDTVHQLAQAAAGGLQVGPATIPATIVISQAGPAGQHSATPVAQLATPAPTTAGGQLAPDGQPAPAADQAAATSAPAAPQTYTPAELNAAHWARQDSTGSDSPPAAS